MTLTLDRADIQGNVLLPYSRTRFPIGALLLLHLDRSKDGPSRGRRFLQQLLPEITTSQLFKSKRTRRWKHTPVAPVPRAPDVLVNVAFTATGLAALGVPQATLSGMPLEFLEGMKHRAAVLNDSVEAWDPIWKQEGERHQIDLAIQLRVNIEPCFHEAYRNAQLEHRDIKDYQDQRIFEQARDLARQCLAEHANAWIDRAEENGIKPLHSLDRGADGASHGTDSPRWFETESLIRTRESDGILAKSGDPRDLRYGEYEHFGFFDGVADPIFDGQIPPEDQPEAVIGQGRLEGGSWHPLAAGEFLLGYGDQAQESPAAAVPLSFSRNGTFLVVRQLHQNVARFEQAIRQQLPAFQRWLGSDEAPADLEEARQLLRAKLVGRWNDGTPLAVAPSFAEWQAFRDEYRRRLDAADSPDESAKQELKRFKRQFTDIRYEHDDHNGGRCPITSHIRRSNPRDSGDPRLLDPSDATARSQAGSVLVNRRRILRRGMTYGPPLAIPPLTIASVTPDRKPSPVDDDGQVRDDGKERGVLFVALCTGIARQFEFMQQQWLNYGSDFGAGNDVCPISGVMAPQNAEAGSKLIIAAPDQSERPPFVMRPAIPAVECRGGAYFFLPSLTALRLIAQGLVDPL